jgi:hypothetical protein
MKKVGLILLLFMATASVIFAKQNPIYTRDDIVVFDKYVQYIEPYRNKPMEDVLQATAEFFLESPYVANTLEAADEILIVNLRELDCTTFVENVIALSLAARGEKLSFDAFVDELRKIRYRNGSIDDYSSRLHYTCDWVFENQQRGIVENISRQLGGTKDVRKIHFMTSHREAYRQLASDEQMLQKMSLREKIINDRGGFYYLTKEQILSQSDNIPNMAMIAFVTSIDGLDVSHVAFAYRQNGKLTFIHASSAAKKVIIQPATLSEYCASQKLCKGVMVIQINSYQKK